MSLKSILVAGAVALAFTLPAAADDMPGMDMSKPMGDMGPSSQAFSKANATMHNGMAIHYSGDADTDFARGMVPHHQGAIDMARIELQYGKDPALRKMASDIIKAQEEEIRQLNAWLQKRGK